MGSVGGKGLFESWGFPAFCQLLTAIVQAWAGGIIVKKFSTVVKNIAKSVSLVVTVFANEALFKKCWENPLKQRMYLLSISIFLLTMLFSQVDSGEKKPKGDKPNDDKPKASDEEQASSSVQGNVELKEVQAQRGTP